MFKVTINSIKHGNGQKWLELETIDEVNQYKNWCKETAHWGLPESTEIIPAVYDEEGNLLEEETISVTEAEYTIIVEDITEEFEAEKERQAKISAGKAARQACQGVLDYIAGINLYKDLTIEQITQMQQTFANAEAALRAGRPTMAKGLISAIVPDGILVTEQEKSQCLLLLANY